MTTDALRSAIVSFLQEHNTLSLATAGSEAPWAASVFFASDGAMNLFFVTDPKTRHGQDLLQNPRVAVTINADCDDWTQIRGLQLTGRAQTVATADRDQVLQIYLNKFQGVARLMQQPGSDQERVIGERLAVTPFYRLRPDWIRLIDNTRRFGFKQELELG